jgi:hypothetical protein
VAAVKAPVMLVAVAVAVLSALVIQAPTTLVATVARAQIVFLLC